MNPPTRASMEQLVRHVTEVVRLDGIHAALAYLNSRTRHRYTGVYLFDPPVLHNLWLFDRENPLVRRGGDTPMDETYCSLVSASRAPFESADSRRDPRLNAHPARDTVIAYCGTPLIDSSGTCFGSLCHFDGRPRVVSSQEKLLLSAVAPAIAEAVTEAGEAEAPLITDPGNGGHRERQGSPRR